MDFPERLKFRKWIFKLSKDFEAHWISKEYTVLDSGHLAVTRLARVLSVLKENLSGNSIVWTQ